MIIIRIFFSFFHFLVEIWILSKSTLKCKNHTKADKWEIIFEIFFFWSKSHIIFLLLYKTAQIKLYTWSVFGFGFVCCLLFYWSRGIVKSHSVFETKSTFNCYRSRSFNKIFFWYFFFLNAQTEKNPNWEIGNLRLVIKNTKLKSYQYVRVCVLFGWWKKITSFYWPIIKMYAWNLNCTIRKKCRCCVSVFFTFFWFFASSQRKIYLYV